MAREACMAELCCPALDSSLSQFLQIPFTFDLVFALTFSLTASLVEDIALVINSPIACVPYHFYYRFE